MPSMLRFRGALYVKAANDLVYLGILETISNGSILLEVAGFDREKVVAELEKGGVEIYETMYDRDNVQHQLKWRKSVNQAVDAIPLSSFLRVLRNDYSDDADSIMAELSDGKPVILSSVI